MARVTSVSLDDHDTSFIEAQVKERRYSSASDVVSAALRLLEERELRIDALRTALIEGENSGASTPFCFDAFIARIRRQGPESASGRNRLRTSKPRRK